MHATCRHCHENISVAPPHVQTPLPETSLVSMPALTTSHLPFQVFFLPHCMAPFIEPTPFLTLQPGLVDPILAASPLPPVSFGLC